MSIFNELLFRVQKKEKLSKKLLQKSHNTVKSGHNIIYLPIVVIKVIKNCGSYKQVENN